MRRRGAAATADDVEPAVLGPFAQLRRERFGSFGKSGGQQRIGQPGIRMGADVDRRDLCQLFDERPHLFRAERAVHADAQQRHVGNGIPKCFDGLAGDAAIAAGLDEGHRGHERQRDIPIVEKFGDGKERRLGVERVEDGFDEQDVGAAVDQAARLLVIGVDQLFEGHAAARRAVDIRGDRTGPIGRPDGAGNKAGSPRIFRHDDFGGLFSRLGAGDVDFVDHRLQLVIGHRDRGGVESIGFDDIGAGFKIFGVDVGDQIGLGQTQQIVATFEIFAVIGKTRAAKILFVSLWDWIIVPMAPSRMTIRSANSLRKVASIEFILRSF